MAPNGVSSCFIEKKPNACNRIDLLPKEKGEKREISPLQAQIPHLGHCQAGFKLAKKVAVEMKALKKLDIMWTLLAL